MKQERSDREVRESPGFSRGENVKILVGGKMREVLVPSRRDRKFLDLALKLAAVSECNQKHGCVIVKGGRVMSLGINKTRNDPAFIESDTGSNSRGTIFSFHAEIDALSRVQNPRGAIVYIARITKGGQKGYSRPCDICAKTLYDAGVKALVYT